MRLGEADNNYLQHIGSKIATARHARGEKETTVARAVGISQGTLSKIESGSYNGLSAVTLQKLAEYLQIPITDLAPPR